MKCREHGSGKRVKVNKFTDKSNFIRSPCSHSKSWSISLFIGLIPPTDFSLGLRNALTLGLSLYHHAGDEWLFYVAEKGCHVNRGRGCSVSLCRCGQSNISNMYCRWLWLGRLTYFRLKSIHVLIIYGFADVQQFEAKSLRGNSGAWRRV